MKKLLGTLAVAAGISLITIPVLARGPYHGQGRGPHGYYGQKYHQCPYDNHNCYGSNSWGGFRFGDGTQPPTGRHRLRLQARPEQLHTIVNVEGGKSPLSTIQIPFNPLPSLSIIPPTNKLQLRRICLESCDPKSQEILGGS